MCSVQARVIILQHIVTLYDKYISQDYISAVVAHLEAEDYDAVILTVPGEDAKPYDEIVPYIDFSFEWQLLAESSPSEAASVHGGNVNDYWYVLDDHTSMIYPWLRFMAKEKYSISLAGGHHKECLRALTEVLDHLKAEYHVMDDLVYPPTSGG